MVVKSATGGRKMCEAERENKESKRENSEPKREMCEPPCETRSTPQREKNAAHTERKLNDSLWNFAEITSHTDSKRIKST